MISKELSEFLDKQDWDSIYRELKLHTVRRLYWAGLNPKEGINGMDSGNIVSHVIEAIFIGKRKPSDKALNNFKAYLQWAINSVIYSIKKKNLRKGMPIPYDEMTDEEFFDQVCEPAFLLDEEKDVDIITIMGNDLEKHDEDMYLVFSELILGKKHKEIAKSFGWTVSEVENIHKKINTFNKRYKKEADKIKI